MFAGLDFDKLLASTLLVTARESINMAKEQGKKAHLMVNGIKHELVDAKPMEVKGSGIIVVLLDNNGKQFNHVYTG